MATYDIRGVFSADSDEDAFRLLGVLNELLLDHPEFSETGMAFDVAPHMGFDSEFDERTTRFSEVVFVNPEVMDSELRDFMQP